MKKYLVLASLVIAVFMAVTPHTTKAQQLIGFLDGNMYDPITAEWRCLFLMDNNCYDIDQNILATRTPTPATAMPAPTISFPIIDPVTNIPLLQPQPTAPAYVGSQSSCTLTEVQGTNPLNSGASTTVTWTTEGIVGISTATPGTLLGIVGQSGGVRSYNTFGYLNSPNGTLVNQSNAASPFKAVFGNVSCDAN